MLPVQDQDNASEVYVIYPDITGLSDSKISHTTFALAVMSYNTSAIGNAAL